MSEPTQGSRGRALSIRVYIWAHYVIMAVPLVLLCIGITFFTFERGLPLGTLIAAWTGVGGFSLLIFIVKWRLSREISQAVDALIARIGMLERGEIPPPYKTQFKEINTIDGALVHAAESRRIITGELHHRVKNMLSKVQAIGKLTIRSSPDLPSAAHSFMERIGALAQAHNLLSERGMRGASLRDIFDAERKALDGGRMSIEGSDLELRPQLAEALTLIVHELGTNALKYGALAHLDGSIKISWRVIGGTCTVHWIEHCPTPVDAPTHHGFGSELIEFTAHGVDAEVRREWKPEGLAFTLEFPLELKSRR